MPGKGEYSIPKSSKLMTIWTVKSGKAVDDLPFAAGVGEGTLRTLRSGNGVSRTVIWGKLVTY
jgi:hypothetical protein